MNYRQLAYRKIPYPTFIWNPKYLTVDGNLPHTDLDYRYGLWQNTLKTIPATADGDVVGAEDNQGYDNYTILQANTPAKPTLKLNVLNSKPVLRLDGGDYLQGAFSGGVISQPLTIFLSVKLSNNSSLYRFLFDGINSSNRNLYGKTSSNVWEMYSGGSAIFSTPISTDTSWHIVSLLFDPASTSYGWLDGVQIMSGSLGLANLTGLTLGTAYSGVNNWIGDLARLLIYDANLTNAAKNQVGRYLSRLYALPYTDI